MNVAPEPAPRPVLSVIAWAAFLACSWTWCIGMFLPALLVRDYGLWGFAVFAAPNLLGAAALGWVLRTRHAAATLARRHRGAITLFSTATIGFHIYWLCWIGTWVPGVLALDRAAVAVTLTLAILLFLALLSRSVRGLAAAAVGLLVVSLAVFVMTVACTGLVPGPLTPHRPDESLLWLAPVCLFGFALCPYLDRTFLTVRAELTTGQARAAFSLGFLVFFGVMILLTLAYAPLLVLSLGGHAAR